MTNHDIFESLSDQELTSITGGADTTARPSTRSGGGGWLGTVAGLALPYVIDGVKALPKAVHRWSKHYDPEDQQPMYFGA